MRGAFLQTSFTSCPLWMTPILQSILPLLETSLYSGQEAITILDSVLAFAWALNVPFATPVDPSRCSTPICMQSRKEQFQETISGQPWEAHRFPLPSSDYTGSASSKLKLLYQRLDFNVSQHIIDAYGFNLYVQPGLEYAYFRLQQSYRYLLTADAFLGTVYQQSRGWGVGPQLGMGFDANLFYGSLS